MPTGMTYASLVTDLKRYSQRGSTSADTTVIAELPQIINRTEVGLAREFKIQGYQQVVTGSFDPTAVGVVDKPTDWLNTVSMNYNADTTGGINRKFLYPRSYEYLRVYWPDDDETAAPKYYADYDEEHWLLAPSPDAAYNFQLVYYATLPMLDDSNQSNWLTEKAPDLLLAACMVNLGAFLGWQDAKLKEFKEAREVAKAGVSTQDLMRVVDRATTRRTS